jgi:opacity protein-like surface antigen
MKRFVFGFVATVVFALASSSALAAQPSEDTVGFVLTAASCPNLAPGTVITGTGTITTVEITKTDGNDATTVTNTTHASGTATDQDGNTYRFNYSNHFRISNTGRTDPVLSGVMVDSFSLAGSGPAQLQNGFRAEFKLDFSTGLPVASFVELSSRGDPIDFATGEARCDPL